MAKVTPRSAAPRPAYSPGYTWMLLFSVFAMAGGCALLYLELTNDYDFDPEPKGLSAVPKIEPLAPPPRDPPRGGAGIVAPDPDRAGLDLLPATDPRLAQSSDPR